MNGRASSVQLMSVHIRSDKVDYLNNTYIHHTCNYMARSLCIVEF